jgi:hypothetical protein
MGAREVGGAAARLRVAKNPRIGYQQVATESALAGEKIYRASSDIRDPHGSGWRCAQWTAQLAVGHARVEGKFGHADGCGTKWAGARETKWDGPNGVEPAQFPIFAFSFLIFLFPNFNLDTNLNSNFCGSPLQIIFVKLEVIILEMFIYILFIYSYPLSFSFLHISRIPFKS